MYFGISELALEATVTDVRMRTLVEQRKSVSDFVIGVATAVITRIPEFS